MLILIHGPAYRLGSKNSTYTLDETAHQWTSNLIKTDNTHCISFHSNNLQCLYSLIPAHLPFIILRQPP